MSEETPKQTLIPKDDDEQWRKVLHGEMVAVDDNETHIDAAKIRSYLIARDEVEAVSNIAETEDLNTLSEDEARVIYEQASKEIKARSSHKWQEFFKTYGVGALVGCLSMAVVYLGFIRDPAPSPVIETTASNDLNYDDYTIMELNELPGEFPNMLLIAGGRFSMGCAPGWDDVPGGCRHTEYPSHVVNVNTFEISQHEVTVGQFAKFVSNTGYVTDAESEGKGCVHKDMNAKGHPFVMNSKLNWRNPGYEQDDGFPVSCISWVDAQAYVAWLSEEKNAPYRLPTEAEWEYAARARKSTAYFWGSQASHNQANYSGMGDQDKWPFASPVGQFPANKFSVQDTAGNVWEWVQDCWHDTYTGAPNDGSAWVTDCHNSNAKVRRGGAWDANVTGIRSAIRSAGAERDRSNLYGFRVAKNWQKQKK